MLRYLIWNILRCQIQFCSEVIWSDCEIVLLTQAVICGCDKGCDKRTHKRWETIICEQIYVTTRVCFPT